jgi:hypothetical protein
VAMKRQKSGGSSHGLPDGLFSKNPKLGKLSMEVLTMEDVGIFMAILSIFLPFGIISPVLVYFFPVLVYFPPFWNVAQRKIWQPWIYVRQK